MSVKTQKNSKLTSCISVSKLVQIYIVNLSQLLFKNVSNSLKQNREKLEVYVAEIYFDMFIYYGLCNKTADVISLTPNDFELLYISNIPSNFLLENCSEISFKLNKEYFV